MVLKLHVVTNIDDANELFLNKKFEDAIFQYELILQDDPHNLLALNNKGYSLSKLKKLLYHKKVDVS